MVITREQGCCGALNHHMGDHDPAMRLARANIAAWSREIDGEGLDGIVINTSGCGTTVKDYGFMFREEPDAAAAAQVAALAMDVTEALQKFAYAPSREKPGLTVAYHSACSLQHGQKITALPKQLLVKAGFAVKEPAEPHLCCGSAGTYNLLQPEIAGKLQGAQAAQPEPHRRRPDRRRQYRLPDPARRRRAAGGAYGRAAGLDGRRAGAGGGGCGRRRRRHEGRGASLPRAA